MGRIEEKNAKRTRRKLSIRKRISGTADRPRMSIFKSNRYIYVQVIDDASQTTVAAVNNLQSSLKSVKSNVADAAKLGEAIASKLKEKNISSVVLDRNGYRYHGVVKAIADGCRNAGIVL